MANITGLEVSAFKSLSDAVNNIFVDGEVVPGFAIALNAEKVVASKKDKSLYSILKKATIIYPDGVSIVFAMKQKGEKKSVRIPGCELWQEIMVRSANSRTPVFIVGGKKLVNEKVCQKLTSLYSVNIVGDVDGFFADEELLIERIKESGAKIVTVAMGSPAQEKFILKCMESYSSAFFMGVGGSYDVFVGEVNRAPLFFREHGLEWLYRLLKQPTRASRQLNLLIFIWYLFTGKI